MADPRADRGAYLDRVAADLRLPPDSTTDVIDELRAHLDAAVTDLEAEGLDPALAEREAIARLGDPTTLATGIRTARQTHRRLLVAAGYGVIAGLRGAIWGYLFAFAVVVLAGIASTILVMVAMSALDLQTHQPVDLTAWLTLPYAIFVSGYAGYRVPPAVARRSDRRVRDVRVPIAVVGAVSVGGIALFGIRLDMTPPLAIVLATTPVAFAVGALLARDGGAASGRIRFGWRTIALMIGVATLVLSAVTLARSEPSPSGGPGTDTPPTEGAWAYPMAVLDGAPSVEIEEGDTTITETVSFLDPLPAGWSDFRLEVWPVSEDGIPAAGVTAPSQVVPYARISDVDWTFAASIERPATTTPVWFDLASTAIDPGGERVLITGPDITHSAPWNGTLWEYLTLRP